MTVQPMPDFVVVGGQVDGKVVLVASRTLEDVELRYDAAMPDFSRRYGIGPPPGPPIHTITAVSRDMITVVGDNYPEAWQTLFECWSPPAPRRAELERTLEIEP